MAWQFPVRRVSFRLVGLAALAITVAASFAAGRSSLEAERQERYLQGLSEALVEFEHAMGYGGFVHNYKNFVLRPSHTVYRARALDDLTNAGWQIDRFEALGLAFGDPHDLEATRRTLAMYRAALDRATALANEGMTAMDIDATVRLDNSPALEAMTDMHRAVRRRMAEQQRAIDRTQTYLSWLFVTVTVLAYGSIGALLVRRRTAPPPAP